MHVSALNLEINFNELPVSSFWSKDSVKELKIHKIHAYPAKFPSFITSKSLEYARNEGIKVSLIADVFCGCGTTALEARRNNIEFWGCDINPVATLIARVKSEQYSERVLKKYFQQIIELFPSQEIYVPENYISSERINYWFDKGTIVNLYKLLELIRNIVPKGKYRNFFLCAFSNILKGTSKWLTKSIKPQIDPNKTPHDVEDAFKKQFHFMLKANQESKDTFTSSSKIEVINKNFLEIKRKYPFVDILITSPPYVTSYEYADLHQLSTLWLGYTEDYRNLREGTIGSLYHLSNDSQDKANLLNEIGKDVVNKLSNVDIGKAKSVLRYFFDMKKVIVKTHGILKPGALAIFVIGNTKYKNVEVDNAKYIAKCMLDSDFSDIRVCRRKVGPKNLTPYRDSKGRFSTNPNYREVYSHEFIIIGKKKQGFKEI